MRISRPAGARNYLAAALVATSSRALKASLIGSMVVMSAIPAMAYSSGSGASSRSSGPSGRSMSGPSSRSMGYHRSQGGSGARSSGRSAATADPRGGHSRPTSIAPSAATNASRPSPMATTPASASPPASAGAPPSAGALGTSAGTASTTRSGTGSGTNADASSRGASTRSVSASGRSNTSPRSMGSGATADRQDLSRPGLPTQTTLLPNGLSADPDAQVQLNNLTSGGKKAILGASGADMPSCMAAWEAKTHISRGQWRKICARTLVDPHI
jgi:hypothetical protein